MTTDMQVRMQMVACTNKSKYFSLFLANKLYVYFITRTIINNWKEFQNPVVRNPH